MLSRGSSTTTARVRTFLKIKSKRASRGSMDTLQSSAMDTLDSSLQSLDSPTVASLESTVMSPLNSPSASVVGFFSAGVGELHGPK